MNLEDPPSAIRSMAVVLILLLALAGCGPAALNAPSEGGQEEILRLPDLEPVELGGEPLKVVATTSLIGDVVAQIGGGAIALTTLMGPGQDPHSYEPAARDLTTLADADVIFVNGWDLEEGLVDDLVEISGDIPIVPISANIKPLTLGEAADHRTGEGEAEHPPGSPDPHVWFSVPNVEQWVDNLKTVLSGLDPNSTETFERNAAAYLAELEDLQKFVVSQLAQIPEEHRFLVTNHDSFSYFAHEYGFTILGAVFPAASTVSEPSARELADLIDKMETHDACTLISETTVNDSLAQTVAAELDNCDKVLVLQLYTGSVGAPGSGADTYLGMFRANVEKLVSSLK